MSNQTTLLAKGSVYIKETWEIGNSMEKSKTIDSTVAGMSKLVNRAMISISVESSLVFF